MSEGPVVRLTVNGEVQLIPADPPRSLLAGLREHVGLTGAKYGCGEGVCGACTVHLDGQAVRSCVTDLGDTAGRSVATIEGGGATIARVQSALVAGHAFQCGYCAPGMVMAIAAALDGGATTADAVEAAIDVNICRCGTYPRIRRAIDTLFGGEPTGPPVVAAPVSDQPELPRPPRPWDLTAPEDRDWSGPLGPGLAVVLAPEELERGRGRAWWSASGGAWLHIGADGVVTAFTGKVDVGQRNGYALAALVAAEIGVGPDAVRLVAGDTDLCPWDVGTFGSRATPDGGGVLRTVAAEARTQLLEAASVRLEVAVDDLTLVDGVVRTRDGARSIPIGDLVRDERRIAYAHVVGRPAPPLSPLAVSPIEPRVEETVTGRLRYTSDLALPAMRHARVLRGPSQHATLLTVDTSRAEAMPGVSVVRADDLVAVVADDPAVAAAALEALDAQWDEPSGVSDGDLEAHLRSHPAESEGWQGPVHEESGHVDAALSGPGRRVTGTWSAAYIAHTPIETRAAVAQWEGRRLTVWVGTQRPFGVREDLSEALGLDQADIRVLVPPTGGGFGGKHGGDVALEAAVIAREVGAPVKVRWSRAEEFSFGYLRPAAFIDIDASVGLDGRIAAWSMTDWNAGSPGLETPYDIANRRIEYRPTESPLHQGAYRALAATANTFARETAMDELAALAGSDPVAFRLAHLSNERLAAVLRAVAAHVGWPGPSGRMGIASATEKGAYVATCAEVDVSADGLVRITRLVTAFECGTIVDRDNLENQIEGATAMALGGALFEAIHLSHGRIANASLSEYRVPRFSDVPSIEAILVDRPDLPSEGSGEAGMICVAPAIASAIAAATDRRLRRMPLAPDGRV
jgi:isoquinoline 1-oxidoreductase